MGPRITAILLSVTILLAAVVVFLLIIGGK